MISTIISSLRLTIFLLIGLFASASACAQVSQFALRFYGAGVNQQDRVRIPIDDDAAGPDASAPSDVGAGDFTIEFWIRGSLADNGTANSGGDQEFFDLRWISGNIVVDRDIFGGSERDWGISVAGGFVRFGTGRADVNPLDVDHTLEGNINVLDGQWHHVAAVREASTGIKRIYVDGLLDFASPPNRSRDDISYPNNGAPGQQTPWGPYIVLAAEKHDAGPAYPSFRGYLDEFRVWNRARTQRELLETYDHVVPANAPGLVGYWRFEEGVGTVVADSSAAGSPAGELIAGIAGNGEWVGRLANAGNTAPVWSGPLPPGFARSRVVDGLEEPTVIEFTPDGRLLIGQRNGVIRVFQGGTLRPAPLISIPADTTNGERGLVGLVLDPNFAANGHFYAYYTTAAPRNRVSRFTVVGDSASLGSEFVVWQNPDLAADYHHGGSLRFGPDGNLYIATGDQFNSGNAQSLANEHGKILRVRPDGTIPPDNPFTGTPGARPAIWAYGLRNPFRFSIDSLDGAIWIGDVGGNSSDSQEEINRGVAGANYGWPYQEGVNCYVSDCTGFVFPAYRYAHNDPAYSAGVSQGSIICGPVYRSTSFPTAYRGNLYVGDYANRWIRRLVIGSGGQVLGDPLFLRAPAAGTIVDLDVGPDGALYYVNIGVPWSGEADAAAVYRVAYVGLGNLPPIASASAAPLQGPAPLAVQFQGSASSDPDGGPQPLTFAWTFGDGGTSTLADPSHTYAQRGQYTARLTVSDGVDSTQSAPIVIQVGSPPTPTIQLPLAGTTYRAGDAISFSGAAMDSEDGPLPVSALSWQVVLVHDAHTHPFLGPLNGVGGGSFTIPSTGHAPGDTYYEIRLTATDSDGLTASTTRDIQPVLTTLALSTTPAGIPIFVDGEPVSTPQSIETLVGFQHVLEAQAFYVQAGQPYVFDRWSDGGPRVRNTSIPENGLELTAIYSGSQQTTLTVPVEAVNRNADWYPSVGQQYANLYDALGLCCGRDGGGVYQTGLEFAAAIPPAAFIVSARIDLVATADQAGGPQITIRAYDVGNAPPFVAGSLVSLTSHGPLTDAGAAWNPPAFVPGQTYSTPDLAALVQEVVSRPDWTAGAYLGFVLDGSGSALDTWRCLRNFTSGQPAVLVVTYSVANPCSGTTLCDSNCDGQVDVLDINPFVLALEGAAGWQAQFSCDYECANDVSGDGAVNVLDINPFVLCIAGG